MNCLSVCTSILSYMIQKTGNVLCITNTRHKNEKIMEKEIRIYRYNSSCIDNEEAAIWLLHGSLADALMNGKL